MVIDLGDVVQVVARSTTDAVDVGKVAQALGGGGHSRAAAAHLRGAALPELRDRIVELVKEYSRSALTVRQIMSAGRPQMFSPDIPISLAGDLMRRWGHEGFPVVETGADGRERLIGVLTRREADRALDHGLGDQPIHRFMRAGQVTVQPDDTIPTLRKTMIDSNWGQIPVVDDTGAIVGIVTRTDLIKLWDEASLPDRRAAEIAARLKRALRPVQHHLLKLIGEEVDLMNFSVYVVGGFVRDLMLEERGESSSVHRQPPTAGAEQFTIHHSPFTIPNSQFLSLDVDIVIEGDAIAFAHRMQSVYGGRVVEHKRFGTAKWQLTRPDAPVNHERLLAGMDDEPSAADLPAHLDFVTARTEFYTEPTVLPTVQQSSIKLDLHRRDFTINTLALCLNPERWGELLDFWGGLNDLKAGLVRVLHSLSFVDDATRILRAVRYEQRFNFRIETRTLELLHDALELLDRVTPARIRHEMERILQEETPEKTMLRLDELGVLRQLHPQLRMDVATAQAFVQLRERLATPDIDPLLMKEPIERLYWALIVYGLPNVVHKALHERLGLRSETQQIMRGMHILHENLSLLADPATRPSQVVAALDEVAPVALALLPVVCGDPQVIEMVRRYRSEWRRVHAELDGHDLRRLGVPRGNLYREILAALRAGRLDGTIHSREEEIALVREATAVE